MTDYPGFKAEYSHDYDYTGPTWTHPTRPRHMAMFAEDVDNPIDVVAADNPFFQLVGEATIGGQDGYFRAGTYASGSWPGVVTNGEIKVELGKITVDPSIVLNPTTTTAAPDTLGSLMYDSGGNVLKYWDGAWKTIGVSGLTPHILDDETYHTATGLTVGHVIAADTATTFSWQAAPTGAHVLATSGPHSGTLPLADLAVGSQGSIIYRDATDWAELSLGTTNYALVSGATDVAWAQYDYGWLANVPSTFAPSAHVLSGTDHTASGLTVGYVIAADSATAFSWQAVPDAPGSGVQWKLPVWDTTSSLGDSMVSQNSGGTALTISGSVGSVTDLSMTGELDLTGTGAIIDMNPSGTGTQTIIDITPTATIGAAAEWTGISLDADVLDPTGANAEVVGMRISLYGVAVTNSPLLEGIRVTMPDTYGGGTEYGIVVEGDGNDVYLCTDTWAALLHGDVRVYGGDTVISEDLYLGSDKTSPKLANNTDALELYSGSTPTLALTLATDQDATFAAQVSIGSIVAGVSDYDKFLVSDTGIIKFRTGAEVASDIGALTGTHGESAHAGDIIPDSNQSFSGQLALSGTSSPLLDLNPSSTTSVINIIDITPSAALAASANWRGVLIDGSALDPAGAGATIFGFLGSFSGVSLTNNPDFYGMNITMPATYAGGTEWGIWVQGDGRTVGLCGDTYAVDIGSGVKLVDNDIYDSGDNQMIGFDGSGFIDFLASQGTPPSDDDVLAWDTASSKWVVQAQTGGAGGVTGSGTAWTLPVWDTTTSIDDSMISQNSGGTIATVNGALVVDDSIDLNPSGTGSATIIDITPTAILSGVVTWKGVNIDGGAMDPTSGPATIYGLDADFSGITVGQNPNITGLRVQMPTPTYGAGTVYAGEFSGENRTVHLCTTSYFIHTSTTIASGLTHIYMEPQASSQSTIIASGGNLAFNAVGYVHFTSGTNQHWYIDAGGIFYFRDQDDGDATRMTLDSATGNLLVTGTLIAQGKATVDGLDPEGDLADSLGSTSKTWLNLYVQDIYDAAGGQIMGNDGAGYIDYLANQGVPSDNDVLAWDLTNSRWEVQAQTGGGPGSGAQWTLPVWNTTTTLGNSMVSQNSAGTAATVGGTLTVTGLATVDGLNPESDLGDGLGDATKTWLDIFVQNIKDDDGVICAKTASDGKLYLNAGTGVNDIDTAMQASPTDDQLLTAQGILEYAAVARALSMYGAANQEWVPLIFEAVENGGDDVSAEPGAAECAISNAASTPREWLYGLALPPTKVGYKLYYDDCRFYISQANISNKIDNVWIIGVTSAGAVTTIDTDSTGYTTTGLKTFLTVQRDCSSYEKIFVKFDVNVNAFGNFDLRFVSLQCFYGA